MQDCLNDPRFWIGNIRFWWVSVRPWRHTDSVWETGKKPEEVKC